MLRVRAAQTETRTGFGVTGRSLACRLTAAHHHQAQRREARTSGCDRRTACGCRSRSLPVFAPRRRPTAGHPRPRCHSSGCPAPALPAHTARGSRAAPVADLGGPRRANGVPGATILLCRLSSQDPVRRDAAIMIRGIPTVCYDQYLRVVRPTLPRGALWCASQTNDCLRLCRPGGPPEIGSRTSVL